MILLFVPGIPQPQGNKTAYPGKPRLTASGKTHIPIRMVEGRRPKARKAFAEWRQSVAVAAEEAMRKGNLKRLDGALRVNMTFYLPRPKAAERRPWPHVKPDYDKLARAVGDALKGIVWKDDAQVCDAQILKCYATGPCPGVAIYVWPLGAP